jgi:hypothetical protein
MTLHLSIHSQRTATNVIAKVAIAGILANFAAKNKYGEPAETPGCLVMRSSGESGFH